MLARILPLVVVFALFQLPPTLTASSGLTSPVAPLAGTILQDYDLTRVVALPGACNFATRVSSNGTIHIAYVAGGSLFYTWQGSPAPPTLVRDLTVDCYSGLDIAFKPSGAVVVAWVDQRNSCAPNEVGWQLYVASSDARWQNVLATPSTPNRVMAFKIEIDRTGGIHAAYIRQTVCGWPYNNAVFYSTSPAWNEVAVSSGVGVYEFGFDFALDTRDRGHVTWAYWGDTMSVWYADERSGWTNTRVDTNPSANWWDDRWQPTLALDALDNAHIVWVDGRNGTVTSYRAQLWTASSADGFVNSMLVLPGAPDLLSHMYYPRVLIDASGIMHVAWSELDDNYNLYYANSTDWNRVVKITDQDGANWYDAYYADRPIDVRSGVPSLFFTDHRSGVFTVWKKSDWDFGPDVTSPVVEPMADRVVGLSTGVGLQAQAWDNDRLVSWNWTFAGPGAFQMSGRSIWANFTAPGTYTVTLTVADPTGRTASSSFRIDVVAGASTKGWARDRFLMSIPRAYGFLDLHPWNGAFPLTFLSYPSTYTKLSSFGSFQGYPVSLPTDAVREAVAIDDAGNLHTAGYNSGSNQLDYSKLSATGATLVGPKALALNGTYSQQPSLAYVGGTIWLAWMDERNGGFDTYLAELDLVGNVIWGPTRLSTGPFDAWQPKLYPLLDRLWVVWWQDSSAGPLGYASVLNLTTMAFEFQSRQVSSGIPWGADTLPDGGLVLAYGRDTSVSRELNLLWLRADGTPAGSPIPVSFDDGITDWFASVALDSAGDAHVAWWQYGNISALRYARVSPSGTMDPVGGLVVHNRTGDDQPVVSIRIGPDGEPRVAYTDGSYYAGATLFFAYRETIPPVASFTVPAEVLANQPATFDATSSTDNDRIDRYEWDFGGGLQASGEVVQIAFPAPGTSVVRLTVADAAGNTNSRTATVTVVPAPTASFTVSPFRPQAGELVTFDGTGSTEIGGSIVNYTWTIYRITAATYYGPVVNVKLRGGDYRVTLVVRDAADRTATSSRLLTVEPDTTPPVLRAVLPTQVYEGDLVSFDASGSTDNAGLATITWQIEGQTFNGSILDYRFATPGDYTVVLTVSDLEGNTVQATYRVHVDPNPLYPVWAGWATAGGAALAAVMYRWLAARRKKVGRSL